MSTAGSSRSTRDQSSQYAPPAPGQGGPPTGDTPHPPRRRIKLFRWSGIVPLLLVVGLLAAGAVLFGERLLADVIEETGTKVLGTQVDVGALRIDGRRSTVELRALAIADPFDRNRNLIEARRIHVELEPLPLLEKKVIVRRLSLVGLRTGTARRTPARPVRGTGFAPQAMRELERWRKQFDVPLLRLTPIDTIRAIVLDPTQLTTLREARALASQTDSVKRVVETGFAGLRLAETLDSARATTERLAGTNVRTLGLAGARRAADDVRRTLARVDSARQRVEALDRSVRGGVDLLGDGVRELDAARQADYDFARGLLALPTFDAPQIGAALFGPVSLDRFSQAMYWAEMAKHYVPPGLLPREQPGPKRLRRAGTTVHFVNRRAHPDFHLQRADLELEVGGGSAAGAYRAAVADVTTHPALVGRPTVFVARRTARGAGPTSLHVAGLLDHRGAIRRDSVVASASGVTLPSFDLPGLPFRAEPGQGTAELRLVLHGDQVAARWTIRSTQVSWRSTAARERRPNRMEALIERVVTGLRDLDMTAELTGPIAAPRLAVRSNLDRAIAQRLQEIAGEEIARAEAKVRAAVDRAVEEQSAAARARVAAVRADAEQRVADARARLEEERQRLDAQLKSLTGGLGALPKLPGT